MGEKRGLNSKRRELNVTLELSAVKELTAAGCRFGFGFDSPASAVVSSGERGHPARTSKVESEPVSCGAYGWTRFCFEHIAPEKVAGR
jgi:hypothetical protein